MHVPVRALQATPAEPFLGNVAEGLLEPGSKPRAWADVLGDRRFQAYFPHRQQLTLDKEAVERVSQLQQALMSMPGDEDDGPSGGGASEEWNDSLRNVLEAVQAVQAAMEARVHDEASACTLAGPADRTEASTSDDDDDLQEEGEGEGYRSPRRRRTRRPGHPCRMRSSVRAGRAGPSGCGGMEPEPHQGAGGLVFGYWALCPYG